MVDFAELFRGPETMKETTPTRFLPTFTTGLLDTVRLFYGKFYRFWIRGLV